MKDHEKLLDRLGACGEACRYASTHPNPETAWEHCNRADWMIWLLTHVGCDEPKLFQIYACWCVRNTPLADGRKVWDLLTDERSKNAVVVAERFSCGEATEQERAAAWAAARDAAGDAAWDAAWAATGAAAGAAAWAAARAAQSNKLRELIPYATVSKLIDAYNKRNL